MNIFTSETIDPLSEWLNPYKMRVLFSNKEGNYNVFHKILNIYENAQKMYLKNNRGDYINFIKKRELYYTEYLTFDDIKNYDINPSYVLKLHINDKKNINLNEFENLRELEIIKCSNIKVKNKLDLLYLKIILSKNINISNLPNLKVLDIFNTPIDKIDTFENLEILECENCSLKRLEYQPKLKKAKLKSNMLNSIPYLPNIEYLDISNNPIYNLPRFPIKDKKITVNITNTNINTRYKKGLKIINKRMMRI